MATATYDKEIQALRDDFKGLKQDIASLTSAVGKDMRTTANNAKSNAHDKLDQAVAAGKAGSEAVQAKIEERPFVTVLTAFGVGLLVGKAFNGRAH